MFRDTHSSTVVFLMGAAVGAVAAALYTSVDGGRLRRRLSRAAEHAADVAEDAVNHADEIVQDTARSARSLAKRATSAFQREREVASHGV